ncbi:nodulin-related protein 1 [Ananas comosus]|uniref:Nodulin-related protein 1 n=1 Tax=Ananas comosus TaxID=4615 RepID=A0A6P5GF03_ANACO|nr:nodulin-related protein 1 [Ananas comosus]
MDSSDYPNTTKPTSSHEPRNPQKHSSSSSSSSPSDLLSSAQVVAGAAMSAIRHDSAALDKGRVAGAAGDLLHAASHYAHLDGDKRFGTYIEKAEGYLHSYQSSHSSTTITTSTTAAAAATTTTTEHSSSSSAHHRKKEEEDEEEEEGEGEEEEAINGVFRRCPECNENGIVRCPVCC